MKCRADDVVAELCASLGPDYSTPVVAATVAAALGDLVGSVPPDALPEMVTRLAVIRLTGRDEPICVGRHDSVRQGVAR